MTEQTTTNGVSTYIEHLDDVVTALDDSRLLLVSARLLLSILWLGMVWSMVRWIKHQGASYKREGKISARGFEFEGRAAVFILATLVGYGIFIVILTPFFIFGAFY